MKMFSWFSKKNKKEKADNPEPAAVSEQVETPEAKDDKDEPPHIQEENEVPPSEEATAEAEVRQGEAAEKDEADTAAVSAEAEPEAEPSEAEAQPKEKAKSRFGLRSMWEATRRIALTPVDPWFAKMAAGLNKTRESLVGQVKNLFSSHKKIDDELWDELEDVLLTADVGIGASERILEELRQVVKEKKLNEPDSLLAELKAILGRILGAELPDAGQEADEVPVNARKLNVEHGKLMVVLMVGVNGAGKTTTTAKIAAHYKAQGFKVLMAAADTFRAAAIDQLQVWADRIGVDLIKHQEGADPAAVVFDAVSAAKARGTELLLVDTAGRLHNKANLMEELRKIRRVAGRDLEGAPHEILLVLDATTGQNALEQARVFNSVTELTGLILCKLDGTSRGGIIVAIAQEFNIPVRYIGVGEGVDDLREFDPQQFLEALFAES